MGCPARSTIEPGAAASSSMCCVQRCHLVCYNTCTSYYTMPVHAMSSCIQQTGGSYLAYRTWAGFLKNWPPLDLEDYSAAHSPMFLFQFAAARRRHKRSIAPFQDPRHFSRRYFYLFLCWAALRGRRPQRHNHTPDRPPPRAPPNRPLAPSSGEGQPPQDAARA